MFFQSISPIIGHMIKKLKRLKNLEKLLSMDIVSKIWFLCYIIIHYTIKIITFSEALLKAAMTSRTVAPLPEPRLNIWIPSLENKTQLAQR